MLKLIETPPLWIIAIIVAILVGHALDIAFGFATRRQLRPGTVIVMLEVLVTCVLLYITVHAYIEEGVHAPARPRWFDAPILLVLATILWLMFSMTVYLLQRLIDR